MELVEQKSAINQNSVLLRDKCGFVNIHDVIPGMILIGDAIGSKPYVIETDIIEEEMYIIYLPKLGDTVVVGKSQEMLLIDTNDGKLVTLTAQEYHQLAEKSKKTIEIVLAKPKYKDIHLSKTSIMIGIEAAKTGKPIGNSIYTSIPAQAQILRGFVSEYKKDPNKKRLPADSVMIHIQRRNFSNNEVIDIEFDDAKLQDEILFLARSLGYDVATEGNALTIYGNINKVPSINEIRSTPLTIIKTGRVGRITRIQTAGGSRFILYNCIVLCSFVKVDYNKNGR